MCITFQLMVIFREPSGFLTMLEKSTLQLSPLGSELDVWVQAVQVVSECLVLPSIQLGMGVKHVAVPPMWGLSAAVMASSSNIIPS